MAQNQVIAVPRKKKSKVVSYNKWGYFFMLPFIVAFILFTLIPLGMTIYNSFFENYRAGLKQIGPNFVGFANYVKLFDYRIFKFFGNTMLMWVMGFVPQILVSLLLAQWFSDARLGLKGSTFFKTVIYLPNLIMAAAFSMLFFALFSEIGPVNKMLMGMGLVDPEHPIKFMDGEWTLRILVAAMNFLMWFGNTTILLMAGILGIDTSLYEAAEVDGANSWQRFTKITLPLLKPIMVFVFITSLIGGVQMFDVPSILTKGAGGPDQTSYTLIMYLNDHLFSKNLGMGGALSVILFIITGILSLVVYRVMYSKASKEAR